MPERGGKMTVYHRVLTGISGISLLPVVFMIATIASISMNIKVIAWVAFIAMATLLVIALLYQKGFKYALLLQIGYYLSFFSVVLLVTYIS